MRPLPLLLVTALAACTQAGTTGRATRPVPQQVLAARADAGPSIAAPRELARRGEMRVEVRDVAGASERAGRQAVALGGYIALGRTDDRGATLSLRVPAARLDAAMDSIAALGTVKSRGTSVEDVTDALVDADARRATLVATRDRLRALMARATAVADVVAVERELTRVQAELESLDARLAALRSRVALSTLDVRLDRRITLGPLGLLLAGIGKGIGKLFVWR